MSAPRGIRPARRKFEPITFERGVTYDLDFEDWANLVYSTQGDGAVSLKNLQAQPDHRRPQPAGHEGEVVQGLRAWVSEYAALPDLDANANAM